MSPLYWILLGATLALEVPLAGLAAQRGARGFTTLTALCLNLVSHPVATLLVAEAPGSFLAVELAVVAAEAAGYRLVAGASWVRATWIAALTNTVTAGAALAILA